MILKLRLTKVIKSSMRRKNLWLRVSGFHFSYACSLEYLEYINSMKVEYCLELYTYVQVDYLE